MSMDMSMTWDWDSKATDRFVAALAELAEHVYVCLSRDLPERIIGWHDHYTVSFEERSSARYPDYCQQVLTIDSPSKHLTISRYPDHPELGTELTFRDEVSHVGYRMAFTDDPPRYYSSEWQEEIDRADPRLASFHIRLSGMIADILFHTDCGHEKVSRVMARMRYGPSEEL